MKTASDLGPVASVIHTAGVSPSMGDADYVMRTNALGTLNVNEVFYETAGEGSVIVNVASMAAHMFRTSWSRQANSRLPLRTSTRSRPACLRPATSRARKRDRASRMR